LFDTTNAKRNPRSPGGCGRQEVISRSESSSRRTASTG
jgi:hypothetical protein